MNLKYIKKTSIEGLLILERHNHPDERGFFREVFHLDELEQVLGAEFKIVQMNHSESKPRVIRGLHAENWNKLVYPLTGQAMVVIADIRVDSATFGKLEIFIFDESDPKALFISKGLANSLCVLGEKEVNYIYLVDDYYDDSDQRAVVWNDSDLAIDWPIKDPILSQRDKNNPRLRDLFPEKFK